jgi:eukaryotic-like serine/threonine-protein kinase
MPVVESCGQAVGLHAAETLAAAPVSESTPHVESSRRSEIRNVTVSDDRVTALLGFRRALSVGAFVWSSFFLIDLVVAYTLEAGAVSHFALLRFGLLVVVGLVLARMHRTPPPSALAFTLADGATYCSAAVMMALLCVEFRGLSSPYVAGFCLVLFSRTVASQDPWRRGLVMNGIPVVTFFAVLFLGVALTPSVAWQLHDPRSLALLLVGASYVLGTYLFLVVNGHIVWSLRRQVFEARNLGRYRLKRRLASGGMGDVWVAYHPGLKRDVAVKILKREEQERSSSAHARFEREVRATADLAHPNTVRVFDCGVTEDGLWYYVMELLEGETLAAHVDRLGPLPPARAIHIVGQAARALGEAHERGIVHRDIKPENIFLTSLGGEHDFVKVIDFGIAKDLSSDTAMTGTGWVMGTPAYMSPEVAAGSAADARSDVYALGEVLYFLLCGRPPFQADNIAAIIFAQVHERVTAPSRILGRQLPADVEGVVMRALEKDPDVRYSTAAELALALAGCKLAGKWTFGDATYVARHSSRPPPSGGMEAFPSLRPPRVPRIDDAPLTDSPPPHPRQTEPTG